MRFANPSRWGVSNRLLPVVAISAEEWELIVAARANVLLCGPPQAIEALITSLRPHLDSPIDEWSTDTPSAPAHSEGSVILKDVGRWSLTQQKALLRWLNDRNVAVRVISTTSAPLYPRVQTGQFLSALYYRLNMLVVDLGR